MITEDYKHRVLAEVHKARRNFAGTDAKFAISLGINNAIYSRLKSGEMDRILSDQSWISLGRKFNVTLKKDIAWKTANTPTFQFITEQLLRCQEDGISTLLCDMADIGKTYTARVYVKTHKNAIYVDCSQVKSKQKLVRFIAKEFGVGYTGKYNDVYADLVFYLRGIDNPIIILDEAGDLDYSAFLELKALWNATERACGWMMMGADGLKEKVRRAIDCKKVGYAEIFSRYGHRYQRVTPEGKEEYQKFVKLQAGLIIQANAPENVKLQEVIHKTDGSLRRIYTELSKIA